jgi:HEAT repeat protein
MPVANFSQVSAVLLLACCLLSAQTTSKNPASLLGTQQPAAAPSPQKESTQPPAKPVDVPPAPEFTKPPALPDNPEMAAWDILQTAADDDKLSHRADAIRALGLVPGNRRALRMAEKALSDPKPEVRVAAAQALEGMRARASIPKLMKAVADSEPAVVLAAAHALESMHADAGYEIYYEVLTGERKASKGVIAAQAATFKDPKKLALLGFEEGIGFVPFAGMGWEAYRRLGRHDASPERAAAARILARDPDPHSGKALANAAGQDKNWAVRAAALESIAKRGDPSLLQAAELGMKDDKEVVSCTAAAATLHLLHLSKARRQPGRK